MASFSADGAAARSLGRLHEVTGVGILIQDYPVVSGVNVTYEQVVEIVSARRRWRPDATGDPDEYADVAPFRCRERAAKIFSASA